MAVADLAEGDEVIIYCRNQGILDEDSVQAGEVVGFHKHFARIRYVGFGQDEGLNIINLFSLDSASPTYRKGYGDERNPVQVYFINVDEEMPT